MPDMNEETKKRLAEIRAQHPVFAERICNECFLITLLDQAQRDTERVEELSKIRELVEFIQFETDSPLLEHTATKALRIFDDRFAAQIQLTQSPRPSRPCERGGNENMSAKDSPIRLENDFKIKFCNAHNRLEVHLKTGCSCIAYLAFGFGDLCEDGKQIIANELYPIGAVARGEGEK